MTEHHHECGQKPVQVGQVVPDFKMAKYDPISRNFGEFSLAEQKKNGKWTVLFFYPADFTFVCATEFTALADQYEKFKALGAEVLTVSTDTQFVHLAWQEHEKSLEKVRYPMGADPTGRIARMFGIYLDDAGIALRGTYVIAPDGKLMNAEVNFLNMGRNVDELLRKLKANIYLMKHNGEACPAQWKDEGDKTLKPGPEMVGKVHKALNS